MLAEYGIEIDDLQADTVARAAVHGLNEPSRAMLEAAEKIRASGQCGVRAEWRTMLVTAMNEGLDSGG